jgi:hypothetical protein
MRRGFFLLAALSVTACASPGIEQASCAYGMPADCYDGRDRPGRVSRDDLTNHTPLVASSTLDITDRTSRDDLANRTKAIAVSTADITDRGSRDDLANRTRAVALSSDDITDHKNRDDLTDRMAACP